MIDELPWLLRSKAKKQKNLEDEPKKIDAAAKRTTKTAAVTLKKYVRVAAKMKSDDKDYKLLIKNCDSNNDDLLTSLRSPSVLRDRTNLTIESTTLKESFAKGKKQSTIKRKVQAPVNNRTAKIISIKKAISDENELYDCECYYNSSLEETGKKKRKLDSTKNPSSVLHDRTNLRIEPTTLKESFANRKEELPVKRSPKSKKLKRQFTKQRI